MKYAIIILIIIVVLGAGFYFYKKDQDAKSDPTIDDKSPIDADGSPAEISDRKMKNQQVNQVAAEATRVYNSTPGSERDKIKAVRPQISRAQSMGYTLTWEGDKFVPYSNAPEVKPEGGIFGGIFGTKESRQTKRSERKQKRKS